MHKLIQKIFQPAYAIFHDAASHGKSTVMQSPILLEIPKPCHEDWNNMTPEGRGCFCAGCSKQVVDFSLMTDHEILSYFSKTLGKTCGRFSNDQLQRPLIPLKEQKRQTWWMAMMLPLLLFFEKSNAQKKKITATKGETAVTRCEPKNKILGKVAFAEKPHAVAIPAIDTVVVDQVSMLIGDTKLSVTDVSYPKIITIKGKLTDAKSKQPLAFASVIAKDKPYGVLSDTDGKFELAIPELYGKTNILFSYVGYESKEITVNQSDAKASGSLGPVIELNEELTHMEATLSGEVVVVGYTIKHKPVRKKDTLAASVKKLFRTEVYKLYPNPVASGSLLNIRFKKPGDYTIQLLDNNSRLIEMKEYNASPGAATATMLLPPMLTAGMYYIRIIDEKKKKQYTDKIIVQ